MKVRVWDSKTRCHVWMEVVEPVEPEVEILQPYLAPPSDPLLVEHRTVADPGFKTFLQLSTAALALVAGIWGAGVVHSGFPIAAGIFMAVAMTLFAFLDLMNPKASAALAVGLGVVGGGLLLYTHAHKDDY